MAIAYDTYSVVGTPATGNISWTHTPVGTPKGVVVWVVSNGGFADEVTSVTYGGTAMTQVSSSPSLANLAEDSSVHCFFLGTSVPAGAQTVAVTTSGSSQTNVGYCVTVTAGTAATALQNNIAFTDNATVDNPTTTLNLGGNTCFVAEAGQSGVNSVTSVAFTGWNARNEYDFGTQIGFLYTYPTIASSNVTVGVEQSADDLNMIAVAVKEDDGSVTVSLTGQEATTAQTGPGSARTLAQTGQEITATSGDVKSALASMITSATATTAQGALSPLHGPIALTGQEATAAQTGPTAAHSNALTGMEATAAGGTLTPSAGAVQARVTWAELEFPYPIGADKSVNLVGQEATLAQGALRPDHTQAITGQEITAAQGALAVAHQNALTGIETTAALGSATAALANALAGLEAASAQGSLAVLHSNALTGQEVTLERGDVTPASAGATVLDGLEATAQQGALGIAHTQDIAGHQATTAQGTVRADRAVALVGQEATTEQGTLTAAIAQSAALTGLAATTEQGALGVEHLQTLAGLEAALEAGTIVPLKDNDVNVNLTGLEAGTASGQLGVAINVTGMAGIAATVTGGVIVQGIGFGLEGFALTLGKGDVYSLHSNALAGQSATVERGLLDPSDEWTRIDEQSGLWTMRNPATGTWTPASASSTTWTNRNPASSIWTNRNPAATTWTDN